MSSAPADTGSDAYWMQQALALADKAAELQEVPVGAVVVLDNQIIGRGWNQPISGCDPTAHAEIMALRDAAQRAANYRLPEAELFVTLEPCSMCAGAIIHARIKRVIYGASEPKAGVVCSQGQFFNQTFLNHQVEITAGVLAEESVRRLQMFFKSRREEKRRLKQRAEL